MTYKCHVASLFTLTVLASATLLPAQSLGDIARQERARRAQEKQAPAKVWTNDNIPRTATIQPSVPKTETAETSAESKPETAASESAKSEAPTTETPAGEDKKKSQEYWQEKFKAARANLAGAEERERLAEDELMLLQTQQARELDPTASAELAAKVTAKSAEVEQSRATTAKAKEALDELEKDFEASGAPADWSETD